MVSLEERLDISSAVGELLFQFFGAMGEFEASPISERTYDGIPATRRRDGKAGRPPFDPDTVPAAQNSSKPVCRTKDRENSWELAGQRLPDARLKCTIGIPIP